MVKPAGQDDEDTRARILDAADVVFIRRGIDGARMQEIADQAGVNKALLHYYFQTKAGLARAAWIRVASSFAPGVLQMMASERTLEEKIDGLVEAYYSLMTRHPYLLIYVLSEAARNDDLVQGFFSPERREAAAQMIDTLRGQIEERVADGRMSPIPVDQFFVTLVSSCLFPFAAQPMLCGLLGLDGASFQAFMERRRTQLPALLKRTLLT